MNLISFTLQIQRFIRLFCLSLATILVCFFVHQNMLLSQDSLINSVETEKATIVLDGKVLFKVGSIDNFTAQERAELINSNIRRQLNSSQPLQLKVFQENEQTVIRNRQDNRHILNVTQSDVISGTTVEQQALVWQDILQENILEAKKQRSSGYVLNSLLKVLVVIILVIGFNLFLYFFGRFCINKWSWLIKNPASFFFNLETPFKIIWNLTIFALQISVWMGLLLYVSEIFPFIRSWRYQVYQTLDQNIFSFGTSQYSAIDILFLLFLTLATWFLIRIFAVLFKQTVLSKTGANSNLQNIITITIQYILSFLGIIILWQIWGFDVSSLAILVSVLGVGIGFGLQNIANNFISGLIIIIERPIQIGDLIQVGDLQGKVNKIGARSTIIKTIDKVSIIIPNSRFLENNVINWHYDNPISRIRIPISVAYGSDLKKVQVVLLKAVKNHPDVLLTPRPQVWFKEFAENSLNFEVCVWINEPGKQLALTSELNYRIAAGLSRNNIEIPFPQRDLHIRSSQLEKIFEHWLQKQGISSTEDTKNESNIHSLTIEKETLAQDLEDKLSEPKIYSIIKIIRDANGITIKDRRYRFNTYEKCFIGQEFVDWLVQNDDYERQEATELGQILIEKKIIHHVTDDHPFMDDYFFYRFYADE